MESSRGQAAIEYLVIFTVVMIALVPLLYIATQNTELSRTTSEISSALNQLSSTADSVYALGPGSTMTVNVYLPRSYERTQASFYGKELILPVYIQGTFQESYKTGKAEVKGNPPKFFGPATVKLTMTPYGYVLINDAKTIGFPAYYSNSTTAGTSFAKSVTIKNIHTSALSLNLVKNGVSWVTLSTSSLGSIASGANSSFTVNINPPAGTSKGIHLSYVSVVDSSTGEEYSWVPVRVRIV
jgi:Flp pilus assembly pilin Flp